VTAPATNLVAWQQDTPDRKWRKSFADRFMIPKNGHKLMTVNEIWRTGLDNFSAVLADGPGQNIYTVLPLWEPGQVGLKCFYGGRIPSRCALLHRQDHPPQAAVIEWMANGRHP